MLVDESSWSFEGRVTPEVMREIALGARARIRVTAYPYRTYGSLEGVVDGVEAVELPSGKVAYDLSVRIEGEPGFELMLGQAATALVTSFHGSPLEYFTRDANTR